MKVNDFPFGELLKRAWQWTIQNKILWVIAFFAGSGGFAMNLSFNNSDKEAIQKMFENSGLLKEKMATILANVGDFIFFVVIMFVFVFLFFLLSLAMSAAVIQANKKIQTGEKYKFWLLVKLGFTFLPRMFLLVVLWGIPNLILLVVAIVGLGLSLNGVGWAMSLLVASVIVGLVYNLYIWLLRHNAYCFLVLENNSSWLSFKKSAQLLKKNFSAVLLASLIEIGVGIAIGIGLILALIIMAIPFVVLAGLLMVVAGGQGIVIPIILGAILSLALLAVVRGASSFFFNAFLTNVFWELKK